MAKTTKEIAGSRCSFCKRNVEDIVKQGAEGYKVLVIASLEEPPKGKPRAYICSHCIRKCAWLLPDCKVGGVVRFR